jgi:transposase-like protein
MYMPKTLIEAVRYYQDEQVCIDTVAAMRWPEGKPVCPKCGTQETERKHYWLKTQHRWKCYCCRKQFSVKVDSVFEDSPLGLDTWLIAMWMLVNCKNGVSSYEIARETGISQKAAWHLLHRIRYALRSDDGSKMGGPGEAVEADEAFIGGTPKNRHKNKRNRTPKYIKNATGYMVKNPAFKSEAGRGSIKIPVFG